MRVTDWTFSECDLSVPAVSSLLSSSSFAVTRFRFSSVPLLILTYTTCTTYTTPNATATYTLFRNVHNLHNLHNLCGFLYLPTVTVTTGRRIIAVWKDFIGIGQFMGSFLCGLIQAESSSSIAQLASVKPEVFQRVPYDLIADSE